MIGFLIAFVVGSVSYVYPNVPMFVRLIGAILIGGGIGGAWYRHDSLLGRIKEIEERLEEESKEKEANK